MKKTLAFLLACVMAASLASCTTESPTKTQDTTGAEATTTTQKTEVTTEDPLGSLNAPTLKTTTVKLNSGTENIRTFGIREDVSTSVLNCNNPGSGFEIVIDGDGGIVTVRTQTSLPCYFRVYVDGEAWNNADGSPYYEINGVKNIEIPAIPAGEHTVRVIRVSEQSTATAAFYNIAFYGAQKELGEADGTAPVIEFVGDGITAGAGLGGTHEDATLGYAYLVANTLGADYALTAFAGQGLTTGTSPISGAYGKSGNYDNGAEFIVVNVGAEDFALTGEDAVDAEAFAIAYKAFLKAIRSLNGSTCKIVCVTTSSNEALRRAIEQVCTELGGATAGYYAKLLTASAAALPTAAESAAYATELAAYLTEIRPDVVTLTMLDAQNTGYGTEVNFDSAAW